MPPPRPATARHGEERPSLVFVGSDRLTGSGDGVLRGLQTALGTDVPIAGGAAGDKRRLEGTLQFDERGVYHDSVAILAAYAPLCLSTGVESGWEPLGKRVRVTKSSGNVVQDIRDGAGGVPFFGFYAYGEYAPAAIHRGARIHNETCVTVVVGER